MTHQALASEAMCSLSSNQPAALHFIRAAFILKDDKDACEQCWTRALTGSRPKALGRDRMQGAWRSRNIRGACEDMHEDGRRQCWQATVPPKRQPLGKRRDSCSCLQDRRAWPSHRTRESRPEMWGRPAGTGWRRRASRPAMAAPLQCPNGARRSSTRATSAVAKHTTGRLSQNSAPVGAHPACNS